MSAARETMRVIVPEHCEVIGCKTHRNRDTRQMERGFADVVITLPDGRLVGRCSDHYLRDLYGAGRGSMQDISDRTGVVTAEKVAAYVPNPAWDSIGTKPGRLDA